jgi:Zn-dependent membrane protease YugP
MISAILLADLSMHAWLALASILLVVCGLALAAKMAYATLRALRSVYDEQEQKLSHCGLTGRDVAGRLLACVGLSPDCIEEGAKIDHYDQLHKRLRLRTQSCVSSSVAALATAAHEVGHAEQFARGYWAACAARYLLVLFVFGAAVLFLYPFAATIAAAGDVNLTMLVALLALVAVVRLPLTFALELDATRRGMRLLDETSLAHETELDGIARMARAAFRVHVVLSLAIVLLIAAGVAVMWLIENGLGT